MKYQQSAFDADKRALKRILETLERMRDKDNGNGSLSRMCDRARDPIQDLQDFLEVGNND